MSFSPLDAGLGNRWLVLTVRNCSDSPVTLPAEPVFEGVNDDGDLYWADDPSQPPGWQPS